jgi:hypothetical protein
MKSQNNKSYASDSEMADRLRVLLAPPTKEEVAKETAPVVLIGDEAAAAYFATYELADGEGEALELVASVRKQLAEAAGVPPFAVWPEAVRAGLLSRGHELSDAGRGYLANLIGRGVFGVTR